MKQILLTAIAVIAVLLTSCSKNDNGNDSDPTFPIKELMMPESSAENPVVAGTIVSIVGTGFTTSDEIWFTSIAKASDK